MTHPRFPRRQPHYPRRKPKEMPSVALLESPAGAELHLRSPQGTLLRVPLADADHLRGLAALAMMAGTLASAEARRG